MHLNLMCPCTEIIKVVGWKSVRKGVREREREREREGGRKKRVAIPPSCKRDREFKVQFRSCESSCRLPQFQTLIESYLS